MKYIWLFVLSDPWGSCCFPFYLNEILINNGKTGKHCILSIHSFSSRNQLTCFNCPVSFIFKLWVKICKLWRAQCVFNIAFSEFEVTLAATEEERRARNSCTEALELFFPLCKYYFLYKLNTFGKSLTLRSLYF